MSHANLLKKGVSITVQCKLAIFIIVLYLSSALCHHCASVFLSFHQSQEDPAVKTGINRRSAERTVSGKE